MAKNNVIPTTHGAESPNIGKKFKFGPLAGVFPPDTIEANITNVINTDNGSAEMICQIGEVNIRQDQDRINLKAGQIVTVTLERKGNRIDYKYYTGEDHVEGDLSAQTVEAILGNATREQQTILKQALNIMDEISPEAIPTESMCDRIKSWRHQIQPLF